MSHGLHYPSLVGKMVVTKIDQDSFFKNFDTGFHYIAQAGLECTLGSSASASQILGLKIYATMHRE